MSESLPFGSSKYLLMLALLFFGRGMDFLSTYVATPTLALEGNPIAKKLGWRWGVLLNVVLCFTFAMWSLTAIIITTTGLLVAARNFHSAWLMRSMGEEEYRFWYIERLGQTPLRLVIFSLIGETTLTAVVGLVLVYTADPPSINKPVSIPYGIGFGIVAFAAVVLFYTSLSLWRLRRRYRVRVEDAISHDHHD
jgi:integral membrane sensor domain MASE1